MKHNTKKIGAVVLTAAVILYGAYVFFFSPTGEGAHIHCVTKTMFNLNCMSCGMTRFVYYMMHGDMAMALKYNVLGPLLLLMLMVIYYYFIRWSFFDKLFPKIPTWFAWAFLIFAVVYSVLRNIPYKPFEFLAPPS